MDLSVIIVNYNVKYFLEQCLLSVKKAIENIDAEIIVIDNNSSDGSKEFFKNKFPDIQFIWSTINHGFGKASNMAAEMGKGKFILFLNPDTIVAEDTFIKCLTYYKSNPMTGAMGVKMIDGCGNYLKESKRSFPDPLTSFYKLSGLAAIFPGSKKFAGYYHANYHQEQTAIVDVIAGAFMMIPKNVLELTGSFDESFFMYGEDIDLSYRIQKAGFNNVYFAETSIIHFKGESTSRNSIKYVRLFYKAMLIFVKKHYAKKTSKLYNSCILFAIGTRGLLALGFRISSRVFKFILPAKNKMNNASRILTIGERLPGDKKFPGIQFNYFSLEKRELKALHLQSEPEFIHADSILFSEGTTLSFKKIISLMYEMKITAPVFVHASESCSIISSNDNKNNGLIIPQSN